MANYGIKIAKVTKSISSSTPSDYHFWSKYRAKSVKYQGSLNVTTNSGTNPASAGNTYTHNYGYMPQFMVFVTAVDGNYTNVPYSSGSSYGKEGDLQQEDLDAYVTSSTVVVSANYYYFTPMSGFTTGIVHTYTFDILLFMEEIETS